MMKLVTLFIATLLTQMILYQVILSQKTKKVMSLMAGELLKVVAL